MKKKIGFIDYSIDEWHANNYPEMIYNSSRREEFELYSAWEAITKPGVRNLHQWCNDFNVSAATCIEQVVEECDCIAVLAPSDPQVHEELADLPLESGKPVYIDKPFAPDVATARRMFEKAAKYNTPMMSSSALRYGSDLQKAVNETLADEKAVFASTLGGGRSFEEYSIHQIEMLVMLLGVGATQVMQCGSGNSQVMLIDYPDERRGLMTLIQCCGFQAAFEFGNQKSQSINGMTDFFPLFIEAMLEFFSTGKSSIEPEETIEIAALLDAGSRALSSMNQWIKLEK